MTEENRIIAILDANQGADVRALVEALNAASGEYNVTDWREVAGRLAEALEPFVQFDIEHMAEKTENHPIFRLDDTILTVSQVRNALAALVLYEAANK